MLRVHATGGCGSGRRGVAGSAKGIGRPGRDAAGMVAGVVKGCDRYVHRSIGTRGLCTEVEKKGNDRSNGTVQKSVSRVRIHPPIGRKGFMLLRNVISMSEPFHVTYILQM